MATPNRRGLVGPISDLQQLVAKDDLDGTAATRRSIDVTGCERVIIIQEPALEAGDGTAGVDIVVVSHDGGSTWAADALLLPSSANDISGTVQANAALNAAGTEPVTARGGVFKTGPFEGPTLLRICRKTGAAASANAVTWVTHAPAVNAFAIGGPSAALATVTHAAD